MDVKLSSPDKLLWPDAGVTKADLAAYYDAVADRLLAALADRPVTLRRHPAGVDADGFFQKNLPDRAPSELRRFTERAESADRLVSYLVVSNAEDLRWLAQMAAVEMHPMTCRIDRRERPDQLILDLDPAGHGGPDVATAAWWTREVLDDLDVQAQVKSTGKRGLHLVVPIERRYGFDVVRALSLSIAQATVARHPQDLTVEMRKAERGDRLLVDWSRGGSAQTVIAPWSPRAVPAATVALPLAWDDVVGGTPLPTATIRQAAEKSDPWTELDPQRLERIIERVSEWGYPLEDRSPRARTGR